MTRKHDTGGESNGHSRDPLTRSRTMRQHRERRRQGLRCLMIEISETQIDGLIRAGLLPAGVIMRAPSAVHFMSISTVYVSPPRVTRNAQEKCAGCDCRVIRH
jgi:hypothetical protein